MDTPMNTLLHGLLSLRDRPDFEKQGWKALFDYYLFGPADQAGAHSARARARPPGTHGRDEGAAAASPSA
jgi:hypothetical protein